MRIDVTVRDSAGNSCDVAVEAADSGAPAAVADALGAATGLAVRAGRPGRELRVGEVLGGAQGGGEPRTAAATARVHVIGGTDAGRSLGVSRGRFRIGRDASCHLVLADPRVSRVHAELSVTDAGVMLRDLGSTNGSQIDGGPLPAEGSVLRPDQVARIGDSYLSLDPPGEIPAAVRNGPPGRLIVNRRARPSRPADAQQVRLPTPATERPQRVPWLAALLPATAGIGLALAMHSIQFLAFALLSPVAVLASTGGDRLHWRHNRRRTAARYRDDLARARATIATALAVEGSLRRHEDPDPARVLRIAAVPLSRVWERQRNDPKLLSARLGLASLPSALTVVTAGHVEPGGTVHAVPVGVDLRTGPLGIAAPRPLGVGSARWVLAQIATLASPADVEVALLLSDDAAQSWLWSRWLPHLRASIAVNASARQALTAELVELVKSRRESAPAAAGAWKGPWLLVVVDRAHALAELPALTGVLRDGPAVGITAICIDERENLLPAGCRTVARTEGESGTHLAIRGTPVATAAVADRVTEAWADEVARSLAPLVDATADPGSAIPDECRLVELLNAGTFAPADVLARWRASSGRADTVVGVGIGGPVVVDLDWDGPHVLVAGTTGAGKSELLQTLIVGLCIAHPPEEISFVLVDYKGGAAFADCARLPHTAGMVTDLDAHLTRRALNSLHAELRRREQVLAAAGAVDLAGYRTLDCAAPLSRLVLVVDEFAALATDLPEFVSGLVEIARRGRSLGLHLVLATQRPAGVVSPEIRANTALRIALRVTDSADSIDVIDAPDAAHINRRLPGRAYIRRGSTTTVAQLARVAGPGRTASTLPVAVTRLGAWRSLPREPESREGPSDLRLLVDAVREAAASMGCRPVARPWLPPLPSALASGSVPSSERATEIPIGLVDLPSQQRQEGLEIDLARGSSVLVAGSARTGRTTFLLSLAIAAAQRLAPSELHVHAIDGDGGLAPLTALPHAGTVASIGDVSVADALLQRLAAEVVHRRALLGRLGFGSVGEARANGHAVPLLLLLVDGWEAFVTAAEDFDAARSIERLLGLLRDGPAAGLTLAVGGDRAALAPRLAGHFGTRLVLRLADDGDYLRAGVPADVLPASMPPGRALRSTDGAEIQLAFAGTGASRIELSKAAARCVRRWSGKPARDGDAPIRIRPLPVRVRLADLRRGLGGYCLGVGGADGAPVTIDLFRGSRHLLVTGPARSGRTTLLSSILAQAVAAGIAVIAAAPPRSALCAVADEHGITVLGPSHDGSVVRDGEAPDTPSVVIIDDSEAFADSACGDLLADWARDCTSNRAVVVAARSEDLAITFRGVAAEIRRSHCGVLLQPGPVDGELLGIRLPRVREAAPPGRGILVGDPAWGDAFAEGPIPIQVALP